MLRHSCRHFGGLAVYILEGFGGLCVIGLKERVFVMDYRSVMVTWRSDDMH